MRQQAAHAQDDIGVEGNQFRRKSAGRGDVASAFSKVDPHIAAFAPAQAIKLAKKCAHAEFDFGVISIGGGERAYATYLLALLRAGRERPCRCTAQNRNELPPPHVLRSNEGLNLPYRSRRSRFLHHSKFARRRLIRSPRQRSAEDATVRQGGALWQS